MSRWDSIAKRRSDAVGRVGPIWLVGGEGCGPGEGEGESEGDLGLVPHLLVSYIIAERGMTYLEVEVPAVGDLGGGA